VLFDLGGTLLHYNAPNTTWEETEKTGARSVYRRLLEEGLTLPPEVESLDAAWTGALAFWRQIIDRYDPKTLKMADFLRAMAAGWQVGGLADSLIEALGPVYMGAIQAHVYPLDGAADTLRALRERGLRVGLISNTIWPGTVHLDDLERHGLLDLIDHKIFSADVEAWKPRREVFQLGLDALSLCANETIFVGDALYHDIWGAQQAGLRAVWIGQVHPWTPDGITVQPDATIRCLPELLDIVEAWQSS
jgi:putative hydrolase of the HAD superfamily